MINANSRALIPKSKETGKASLIISVTALPSGMEMPKISLKCISDIHQQLLKHRFIQAVFCPQSFHDCVRNILSAGERIPREQLHQQEGDSCQN